MCSIFSRWQFYRDRIYLFKVASGSPMKIP
jgi:hypothetical protein